MVGYQNDGRFLDAIADAEPHPYWVDLCVVGGGYTGLWTAILAKERNPSRDVVLIDAHEVGRLGLGFDT